MTKRATSDPGQSHPLDVALGQRIRARRKVVDITQAQLGDALGVSFQQIQKYERGKNRVSFSMLIAITQRLGCSVGELIEGIDNLAEDPADRLSGQDRELLKAFAALTTDALKQGALDLIRQLAALKQTEA